MPRDNINKLYLIENISDLNNEVVVINSEIITRKENLRYKEVEKYLSEDENTTLILKKYSEFFKKYHIEIGAEIIQFNSGSEYLERETLVFLFNEAFRQLDLMDELFSDLKTHANSEKEKADETDMTIPFTYIQDRLAELTSELNSKISEGINNVLSLKKELQLSGNYVENITSSLSKSIFRAGFYFALFIFSLTIASGILLVPFFIDSFETKDWYFKIGFRISLIAPTIWASNFIFTHYKYYRVAAKISAYT